MPILRPPQAARQRHGGA